MKNPLMGFKGKRVGAVILVLPLFVAAACGSSSNGSNDDGSASMTIGGFIMPSPVEFGKSSGVFGSNVKFTSLDSGAAALPLLKQGQLSGVTDMSAPPAALALAKGVPIKIVWISSMEQLGFAVSKDIQSPADLKGKKIGTALGTIGEYTLDQYLLANGMKPSDVKKIEVPPAGMASAMKTGQIDGAYIWAPFPKQMVDIGNGHLLAETTDPAFDVVSAEFAKKNPAAVQALVCSLAKAHEGLLADPDKGYEAIGKRISTTADQVKEMMPTTAVGPVNQLTIDYLGTADTPSKVADFIHTVGNWLVENKKATKALSLDEVAAVFDRSYAEKVAAGGCK